MVILASQSPRRQELLRLIFPVFSVRPTSCDESCHESDPERLSVSLALRKAMAAKAQAGQDDLIIACDTVVFIEGSILGKPENAEDAKRMLRTLSGRTHVVCSGVAVAYKGKTFSFCERTCVCFRTLEDREIEAYVSSGEPMDKAGAYGIQGKGALFVSSIEGDFYNVMGLPVCSLYQLLRRLGAV